MKWPFEIDIFDPEVFEASVWAEGDDGEPDWTPLPPASGVWI